MLRIIAGTHKGTLLDTPKNSARPLTDRIRTSIFDLLQQYIPGSNVLDVFAGSGSFGFECISRGAESATFIDASEESISILHQNSKKFSDANINVIRSHADGYLRRSSDQYRIIFADPPFPMQQSEIDKMLKLAVPLIDPEEGILIVRIPQEKRLEDSISGKGDTAQLIYSKKYGKSIVGFYRL